jgi:hypothetical protein
VDAVTQHLLVRWPDKRRVPRGTIGRYRVQPPDYYAFVADPAAFTEWSREQGRVGDCGHATQAWEKLVRERALEAWLRDGTPPPPGVRVQKESECRIRVWPTGVRDVDELVAFMWESAVDVVRPRPSRRVRSARRARWRR